MKKIIAIVGGGFAGLSASDFFYQKRKLLSSYEVVLIDRKKTFDFLPLAPDVLAGWLDPKHAQLSLEKFTESRGFNFINQTVEELDYAKNLLRLSKGEISYDYAIIAAGGEVNFFGRKDLEERCLKLSSIQDALKIKSKIFESAKSNKPVNLIITGAGYTGLEVAINAQYLLAFNRIDYKITIIENRDSILSGLPVRLKQIALKELASHGIEVILGETVSSYEDRKIVLKSGREFSDAICVWSAGVNAPSFLQKLDVEKVKGRIKVDEKLNIYGKDQANLFLVGDACSFTDKKTQVPLRMAVMFSIGQAKVAAQNIINLIRSRRALSYSPVDLGYLIPLTYHKAPGIVLGHNVGSRIGYMLHYLICIYRTRLPKGMAVLKDLLFKRFLKLGLRRDSR